VAWRYFTGSTIGGIKKEHWLCKLGSKAVNSIKSGAAKQRLRTWWPWWPRRQPLQPVQTPSIHVHNSDDGKDDINVFATRPEYRPQTPPTKQQTTKAQSPSPHQKPTIARPSPRPLGLGVPPPISQATTVVVGSMDNVQQVSPSTSRERAAISTTGVNLQNTSPTLAGTDNLVVMRGGSAHPPMSMYDMV